MGFGIWDWDGNGIWDLGGIWDWGGIMTNGMGWDGYGMGFDTNGNWDSPIPINMGGKYIYDHWMLRYLLKRQMAQYRKCKNADLLTFCQISSHPVIVEG